MPGRSIRGHRVRVTVLVLLSLLMVSVFADNVVVDMDKGFVLVSAISAGSVLGVLASRSAKLGTLGYEIAMFANRTASVLTPQLIEELKASVES
jgi:hypothetical protein